MKIPKIIFFLAFISAICSIKAQSPQKICMIPPIYETIYDRILVFPERKTWECEYQGGLIYDTITERKMVQEEKQRWEKGKKDPCCPEDNCFRMTLVTFPAEYITTQTIHLVQFAEMYDTIATPVLIREETGRWEYRKDNNCTCANPDDCRVMCLVTIPAEYIMVQNIRPKKKYEHLFHCKEAMIPAVYKTITKRKILVPAQLVAVPENESIVKETENTAIFSVYPNPCTSTLFLHVSQAPTIEKVNIEIWSIEGKLCQKIETSVADSEISVANLSEGVYILSVSTHEKSENLRFIKQ